MAASILFLCYSKVDFKIGFLHNKKILRRAGGLGIADSTVLLQKIKHKKSPTLLWGSNYLRKFQEIIFSLTFPF
jgi:hypothetical protein